MPLLLMIVAVTATRAAFVETFDNGSDDGDWICRATPGNCS